MNSTTLRQANRVFWWQFPSLSDTPIGPWSLDLPRLDDDPLDHWYRAIDWMAELGINTFIGNVDSYLKGARHSQCPDWPFGLVCEWPNFPKAQLFPRRHLEHGRRLFNAIIARFHEKNIRVFLHHYNFFAPYQWVIHQPDLVARRRLPDGASYDLTPDRHAHLARSVCPNAPVYRDFMRASWQELFDRLTGLDGLLISMGESNWCPCPECTGGVPIDAQWQHAIRREQLQTFGAFAQFYVDTLTALGKEPMIRCWHGGGDEGMAQAMPKGIVYIVKYSGFNSTDCGPDPIYRFWKNAGHRLWVVHEVAGLEPAGPCTWLNPQWVSEVNRRALEEMPIEGSVAFHNSYQGRLDHIYPPIFFNMEAAARFFNGQDYDKNFWRQRAQQWMGPAGPAYLEAGELYSQIILNIDKVVGMTTDGIEFCFHSHLLGDPVTAFPGVIGELGPNGLEAHTWVRENVAILRRYKEYLDDCPWTDDIFTRALPDGQIDPIAFLKEKWSLAQQGLKHIEQIKLHNADGAGKTIHQIMDLSARWAVEYGRFWHHFCRAKVYWWGANSLRTELPVQKKLAQHCLADLDEMIDAVWELQGIYYEFPTQYMHWARALNGQPLEEKLRHYRKIREDVGNRLAPLLQDKVFKWPAIAHFRWPDA